MVCVRRGETPWARLALTWRQVLQNEIGEDRVRNARERSKRSLLSVLRLGRGPFLWDKAAITAR